jgi:2-methylcitrate dehydratase PrpD
MDVATDRSDSVTQALVSFACGDAHALAPHSERITDALLDTVAVALAARGEPGSSIVHAWAESSLGWGTSTIWSHGDSAVTHMAALLNGADADELDFDDVSPTMPMHPSAVLFAAILAVAEARNIAWAQLADAYDVGSIWAVCDPARGGSLRGRVARDGDRRSAGSNRCSHSALWA